MQADFPLDLQHMHWQTWVIPVVGLASAGLALVMGRVLLRRPAPPTKAPDHSVDSETPTTQPPAGLLRTGKYLRGLVSGLDPFDQGSAKERRAALRRTGKCVKVMVSESDTEEPEHGYIVDRSLGGICFTFPRSLPENQNLRICAAEGEPGSHWVLVQVKRCERKGDQQWEIGVQYVQTATWATMLQFG